MINKMNHMVLNFQRVQKIELRQKIKKIIQSHDTILNNSYRSKKRESTMLVSYKPYKHCFTHQLSLKVYKILT
jgi:hypothetical protein